MNLKAKAKQNWAELSRKRGVKAQIAKSLEITKGSVSQWSYVPSERALSVSSLLNKPLHYLRPDIYPDDRKKVS